MFPWTLLNERSISKYSSLAQACAITSDIQITIICPLEKVAIKK